VKLSPSTKEWLHDTVERVGSTLAEAALAYLTTKLASLPPVYVLAFTPALAAFKAQIAKLVSGTVSPASLAPAVPEVYTYRKARVRKSTPAKKSARRKARKA
jgi:hypothetical protein